MRPPAHLALAAALCLLPLASPLADEELRIAPTLLDLSGSELQTLMQIWGYRADLDVDDVGDPLIRSATSGVNYHIIFFDCDDTVEPRRCSSLLLHTGFDFADGIDPAIVNQWNAASRFGRAYVDDEGDPILEWDVLVEGGLTVENLQAQFERWDRAIGSFAAAINE